MRRRLLIAGLALVAVGGIVVVGLLAYGWADARSARADLADRLVVVEATPDLVDRVIALEAAEAPELPEGYDDGDLRSEVADLEGRITTLGRRIDGLREQVQEQPAETPSFIVVEKGYRHENDGTISFSTILWVRYQIPGGGTGEWEDEQIGITESWPEAGEFREQLMAQNSRIYRCWSEAIIGLPLPGCMRS